MPPAQTAPPLKHIRPMRTCFLRSLQGGKRERLIAGVLVLAVSASTGGPQRDAKLIRKAEVNQGCPAGYYRGVGGNCVMNPTDGPYKPDSYWTPCDYSLGPQFPEGCGE